MRKPANKTAHANPLPAPRPSPDDHFSAREIQHLFFQYKHADGQFSLSHKISTKNYLLRQPTFSVYFPYRMEFEYDPTKSQSNKVKHGIDFDEAQVLWLDEDRVEFPAPSDTEERRALIAKKDGRIWVAFYTIRKAALRIISVRRARENEEKIYYDSQTTGRDF